MGHLTVTQRQKIKHIEIDILDLMAELKGIFSCMLHSILNILHGITDLDVITKKEGRDVKNN